ncbi:hypothetical protein ACLKA6_016461 [Drosophila palustris]
MVLHIFRNLLEGKLLQGNDDEEDSDDEEETDDDENEDANDDCAENDGQGYDVQEEVQRRSSERDNDSDVHSVHTAEIPQRSRQENRAQSTMQRRDYDEQQAPRFAISFRDIEESIRVFDGSDEIAIEVWVAEFEEQAEFMRWSNLQKLIFAKKSLKGIAKLFVLKILFNRNGVKVSKMSADNIEDDAYDESSIMKIDAVVDNSKFDINNAVNEFARREVRDIITTYKPEKSKTTNIEMKIVLKDETPIFSRPRRCALTEARIIEDQIDEWLQNDRGSAFTAQDFLQYCDDEKIKLVKTTTGLPRVNGQVERLNAIVKVKHNNAYDVEKVGSSDGPKHSSSCAEYLKPWSTFNDEDSDDALEASA